MSWGCCRVKVPKKSPSICMWMVWTLATLQTFNFLIESTIGGGKGRQCAGAAFGGAKIWNYEILAASGELTFALETMIFYSYTPNTPPVLVSHPLYCQCCITPYKAVCTPRNLHCWSGRSFACCKTVEDRYCPIYLSVPCSRGWCAGKDWNERV